MEQNNRPKAIIEPLKGIHGKSLRKRLKEDPKYSNLTIRVSAEEKESIKKIASALHLSAGKYLLKLHRISAEKLKDEIECG